MPLPQSSHIIGPLRGRDAGGYSVLPVVPVEVWFNKSIFSPPKSSSPYITLNLKGASLVIDWL